MIDKIKASFYGFVIGDALGVPVEFLQRKQLEKIKVSGMLENKTRRTTKGYWSDDTAMTLCTMKSIFKHPKTDIELHEEMMKNYRKWLEDGYMAVNNTCFGIGQTIFKALNNYKNSNSFIEYYVKNNTYSDKNGGNGAMMRILPLILYLYSVDMTKYNKFILNENQIYRKYDFIEFNVVMTHNSRISTQSCIFYTMLIFNILDGMNMKEAYYNSIDQHISWYAGCQSSELKRILDKTIMNLTEEDIKSSGYVVDTLEASLWCIFNTGNYHDAVLKAVNLGGDTDTIGAITGSLAGLIYGFNDIPSKWLEELCEKNLLEDTLKDFETLF